MTRLCQFPAVPFRAIIPEEAELVTHDEAQTRGGGRNTNTAARVGEMSFRFGETWVYVPAEFLRNRANQKQGLYQGQGKSFTKPTQYFSTPNRDTVWAAAATMILDERVRPFVPS